MPGRWLNSPYPLTSVVSVMSGGVVLSGLSSWQPPQPVWYMHTTACSVHSYHKNNKAATVVADFTQLRIVQVNKKTSDALAE